MSAADEPCPSNEGSEGSSLQLEFCGILTTVSPLEPFRIGRDADLVLDDNPYLHRRFLEIVHEREVWWLQNVGSRLSATLSDDHRRVESWLAPGAHLPIVFAKTTVGFIAGPTRYELCLHLREPLFSMTPATEALDGETTLGRASLTEDQWLCVLSLAEPMLRREGQSIITLPSNTDAAARLGWTITKFNRKLDNVCQKLKKAGVRGLHGASGDLASDRRARLVEYALTVRIVAPDDLAELDQASTSSGE